MYEWMNVHVMQHLNTWCIHWELYGTCVCFALESFKSLKLPLRSIVLLVKKKILKKVCLTTSFCEFEKLLQNAMRKKIPTYTPAQTYVHIKMQECLSDLHKTFRMNFSSFSSGKRKSCCNFKNIIYFYFNGCCCCCFYY